MKPCFFCNSNGHRPPPGNYGYPGGGFMPPPMHPPVHCIHCDSKGYKEFAGRMDPCFFCNKDGQRPLPGYYGHSGGCMPLPMPPPVHCFHCSSKGFKESLGRMDPCFFCNKNRQHPFNPNAVYCIHCESTGYKS